MSQETCLILLLLLSSEGGLKYLCRHFPLRVSVFLCKDTSRFNNYIYEGDIKMTFNKKTLVRTLILFMIALLSFTGCQAPAQTEEQENIQTNTASKLYPLEITDSMGRKVTIENEPQRIISIAPNITETIYALGMEAKLVARTDYCDYPEQVLEKESIGSLREPNIEKILELDPDLIIASTHFDPDVLKKLEDSGLTVAVLYGEESFEGVYDTILKTGKLLNADENANAVVADMQAKVKKVKEAVENQPKPKAYYVVSYGEGGDYTATGETFISQIIDMAGGENIANDATGWKYNLEALVEKDPDIVICSKYFEAKAGIKSANGYNELTAVKEGRLFEIDNNMLDRQGPRLADGLETLAKILHPDKF